MSARFRLTPTVPLEHDEQVELFRYAKVHERTDPRWRLLSASQNGLAASSKVAAARAKAAGMKKGFPDISLPVPRGPWHGLYIELKRVGAPPSDVTPEQRQWLADLTDQGYRAIVARGWVEAVEQIETYLQGWPFGVSVACPHCEQQKEGI